MSKYKPLWEYVAENGKYPLILSFEDIEKITGVKLDHSLLTYKSEAAEYGFSVKKISLKAKTILFDRL